jgi:hypothetical protein
MLHSVTLLIDSRLNSENTTKVASTRLDLSSLPTALCSNILIGGLLDSCLSLFYAYISEAIHSLPYILVSITVSF